MVLSAAVDPCLSGTECGGDNFVAPGDQFTSTMTGRPAGIYDDCWTSGNRVAGINTPENIFVHTTRNRLQIWRGQRWSDKPSRDHRHHWEWL